MQNLLVYVAFFFTAFNVLNTDIYFYKNQNFYRYYANNHSHPKARDHQSSSQNGSVHVINTWGLTNKIYYVKAAIYAFVFLFKID